MRIERSTLVFFDASCLIAAAGSPTGGSGYVLSLCARDLLRAAVSQPVLVEAEGNIVLKMSATELAAYHRLLTKTPMIVATVPDEMDRQTYQEIVGEKDDHVLAAALAVQSPFLLTLDRRLARQINHATLPISALSPGEFIHQVLPAHPDYPLVRE